MGLKLEGRREECLEWARLCETLRGEVAAKDAKIRRQLATFLKLYHRQEGSKREIKPLGAERV